jgi:hypothetical protein
MEMLSEYEQLREKNIARNKDIMKALGLDQHDFDAHHAVSPASEKAKKDPAKKTQEVPSRLPSRRSSRLTENETKGMVKLKEDTEVHGISDGSNANKRTFADLIGSRHDHDEAEREHIERWAGKQGKATIVGTASYTHTLMRTRTMSEEALARRIKAIERAAGKVFHLLRNSTLLRLMSSRFYLVVCGDQDEAFCKGPLS